MKKPLALYIHVPFCKAKCTYCDFYSVAGREDEIPGYIDILLAEIRATFRHLDVSQYEATSVFFGGGTPGLLNGKIMQSIIDGLKWEIPFSKDIEISIEANPGETSQKRFEDYLEAGINRLSMGAQSFNDENLRFMSRIHNSKQIEKSYHEARNTGFNNINLDLIFGLPKQSLSAWTEDLKKCVELSPEHISAYSLTVEEGTALHRWVENGNVEMMEDIQDLEMFHFTRSFLTKHGYTKYEISNYAKAGYECRHNMHYWLNRPYLSFGPSAHSYFNHSRWYNLRNLTLWQSEIKHGKYAFLKSESIDTAKLKNEMIFTRFRLIDGISLKKYTQKFNEDLLMTHASVVEKWSPKYLSVENSFLKLSETGFELADEITSDFMIDEDL